MALIDQAALAEVFPNNPLKEVAFEVRYPFNLRIQRDVCDVQAMVRAEYPNFQVDEIQPVDGSPARLHTFQNTNGTRMVRVGEDRFIVAFTEYKDFDIFQTEALGRTKEFCNLFGITQFSRVGLRYINNVDVGKEGSVYQVTRVVNPYFDVKRATESGPMRFQLEVTMKKPSCFLTLRTAFAGKPVDQPNAVYLLDLDAFVLSETAFEDLEKVLNELHFQSQVEFLTHVTEAYKEVMRGRS